MHVDMCLFYQNNNYKKTFITGAGEIILVIFLAIIIIVTQQFEYLSLSLALIFWLETVIFDNR